MGVAFDLLDCYATLFSMIIAWWVLTYTHSMGKSHRLLQFVGFRGGRVWAIQVLGVPFGVLWSHILGGYIDMGSAMIELNGDH